MSTLRLVTKLRGIRVRSINSLKHATATANATVNLWNSRNIKINNVQRNAFHSSIRCEKIVAFNLADIGEGITECELIQWFVKPGDKINQFDRICEVQSDKASVEITSRYDGTITKLHCEAGNMAKVGSPLVDIDTDEVDEVAAPTIKEKKSNAPTPVTKVEEVKKEINNDFEKHLTFATPAVRRIARENQIDLSKVIPTGKGNRVLKEDILAFIAGKQVEPIPQVAQTSSPISTDQLEEIQNLTLVQKAMFKSMTASLGIPHFGYSDEFNLNSTNELRKIINEQLVSSKNENLPKKISYLPILIKALSVALLEFPILNSKLIYENEVPKLLKRNYHNIGVAMDTKNGLLVPNIKDVQNKSIIEIAQELQRLQLAGQTNSISNNDLKNGTITLSNIGTVGGTNLSPVIVTSELCIGALGRIQTLPRYINVKDSKTNEIIQKVVPHAIMPISFSADHRVVDGATMARFSEKWRSLVENPISLLAHLK